MGMHADSHFSSIAFQLRMHDDTITHFLPRRNAKLEPRAPTCSGLYWMGYMHDDEMRERLSIADIWLSLTTLGLLLIYFIYAATLSSSTVRF